MILEEVEFTLPIVAHNKGVNAEFLYVGYLLLPCFLGNNKVNVSDCLKQLLTLFIGGIESTRSASSRGVSSDVAARMLKVW